MFYLKTLVIPLESRHPTLGILIYSEVSDEMTHYAAFHQALHCFARTKPIFIERNTIIMEIITYDPSIYTYNGPS